MIMNLLKCMIKKKERMLFSYAQNSACDSAIVKMHAELGDDYVCVRLHTMGK